MPMTKGSRVMVPHSILSMTRGMFLLFIIWVVLRFLEARKMTDTVLLNSDNFYWATNHKRRAQPTNAKYDCQLLLFIQAVAMCMLYCEPQCITNPQCTNILGQALKCTLVRCMNMYTILVYKKQNTLALHITEKINIKCLLPTTDLHRMLALHY